MALTLANVATPMAQIQELPLGHLKARMVDITFDASYLTTGEVLTPAQMGWSQLFGVITLHDPANAAGTLSIGAVVRPVATGLSFIAQETSAAVDGPFKEATSAQDLSTFTGRFIVLGW